MFGHRFGINRSRAIDFGFEKSMPQASIASSPTLLIRQRQLLPKFRDFTAESQRSLRRVLAAENTEFKKTIYLVQVAGHTNVWRTFRSVSLIFLRGELVLSAASAPLR